MICWERRGRIGVATIDRPERRNALDGEHCDELRARFEAEREVRAVVLTGSGSAFCAGADLGSRFGESAEDTFRRAFDRMLDEVVDHPAPVIAAVHGPAIGAGCQLAVACDLRVVGPDARFGIPAARLGVFPSPPNMARLAGLVGPGPARDLMMTARIFDADEAAAVGLVTRAAADPVAASVELAEQIAALAPLTVSGAKRALNLLSPVNDLPEPVAAELTDLEKRAMTSDDVREGMAAFGEKRSPRFNGT
ncbi:MAG: enoyl-CoA hydratase/isomerase family protein [Acidimicrobiia bacterium]